VNNSGTFNVNGPEVIGEIYNPPGTFNNTGTLNVAAGSGGTAYFTYGVPLNNSNAVNVTSGTLGVDSGGVQSGSFNASGGTLIDFDGGTDQLGGTVSFTGTGQIALTSGSLTALPSGTTLNVSGNVFAWNGGTISVPVGSTLNYQGTLGIVGSNDLVIGGGGTFNLVGTVNQTGTGSLRLDGSGTTSTVLNIPAGSVYNLANNSGIKNGNNDGGIIVNAGTIEKTAGSNVSTIAAALNSSAAIVVNTGTLALGTAGGTNTGGTFTVAAGAALDLTGGQSVSYSGTFTGSGAGQVQLNGGTLNAAGGSGGVTFNFPTGLFNWTGGTINTANTTVTIPATGKLQIGGNNGVALTGGGTLTVAGTTTQTGLGNLAISNGTTLNLTGTYNLQNDSGISQGSGGGGVVSIATSGILEKLAGSSTSTVSATVNNLGHVYSKHGTLKLSGTVVQLSAGTLTGGTWASYGSATVDATIDIGTGAISTIGPAAVVLLSGLNSSVADLSALNTVKGTFELLAGQSFATPGALTVTGGLILGPACTLSVNGNYTQASTAKLTVQIGGTAASPTVGALSATGTVSLAGTLTVTAAVVPPVGTVFTILNDLGSSAVGGIFTGLPEGAQITVGAAKYTISYVGGTGNDVTLTRTS
jgi:hypothetical protein